MPPNSDAIQLRAALYGLFDGAHHYAQPATKATGHVQKVTWWYIRNRWNYELPALTNAVPTRKHYDVRPTGRATGVFYEPRTEQGGALPTIARTPPPVAPTPWGTEALSPPTFTNGWARRVPWVEEQQAKTDQTVLTITKALTRTTNCTF